MIVDQDTASVPVRLVAYVNRGERGNAMPARKKARFRCVSVQVVLPSELDSMPEAQKKAIFCFIFFSLELLFKLVSNGSITNVLRVFSCSIVGVCKKSQKSCESRDDDDDTR